jgi:molybdate transport system substrate-binding protein
VKKTLSVLLALLLCAGCASAAAEAAAPQTELIVFAAASMTEAMNAIAELYKAVAPNVTVVYNFDSSGTLQTQIEEGAEADVFISAGQKQMNALDGPLPPTRTPRAGFVLQGTRFDLLTNTIVLIVPEGSDKGIASFEDVATDKVQLLAVGNSDVPVGQYAQDVFEYLGIWDQLNSDGKITFGSNVKEVLAQVESAAVDCGVVYVSDAATGTGITVVATRARGSHKPLTIPPPCSRIQKTNRPRETFSNT